MFGAEFSEFISFGKQLGLALAGAASLWGFVFALKGNKEKGELKRVIFSWVSERLLILLYLGLFVASICWAILLAIFPAYGHEGITIAPSATEKAIANYLLLPVISALALYSILGLLLKRLRPEIFSKYLAAFYLTEFIAILVLISFPGWTGTLSRAQIFFFGHSVHSIFTVGTVLTLDFLFLISRSSDILKQNIFPYFPKISKVIWVGLAADFLSVALVFPEAVTFTPKFFFMQSVVGILIINGVFLAGPVTRKILSSLEKGAEKINKKWLKFADIAGTISISSWLTITFVDFFEHLTLGYAQFLFGYVALILVLFLGHRIFEFFEPKKPEFI